MVSSLISRLNTLTGKTPDEVVQSLNQAGWTPCALITVDTHARWLDQNTRLTIGRPDGSHWYINGMDFRPTSWLHRDFINLTTHWVIPTDNYVEGEHPDVAAAHAADRARNR